MKQRMRMLVLSWLRFWAKIELRKFAPDLVGITGSVGKSSTVEAVATILKDKYRLKVTRGANSESGIPLHILGIKPSDFTQLDWLRMCLLAPIRVILNWQPVEKYVVEMGIDEPNSPKNMEYLLTILKPRTGVFLNVLPVHTQQFGEENESEDAILNKIAAEKAKMILSLPKEGLAILNADDPRVIKFCLGTVAQVITVGQNDKADLRCINIVRNINGTQFEFKYEDQVCEVALRYLLPDYYLYAFGTALVLGLDEGMLLSEAAQRISDQYCLPPGRMSMFKGIKNSLIIDSSYNSSLSPALGAIEMVVNLTANRRVAILGDMRELGGLAASSHKRLVDEALLKFDKVILVGKLMKNEFEVNKPKFSSSKLIWFKNAKVLSESVENLIDDKDLILVKGSQNTIYLETVVERLLNDKNDVAKLCRRGIQWQSVREKFFLENSDSLV